VHEALEQLDQTAAGVLTDEVFGDPVDTHAPSTLTHALAGELNNLARHADAPLQSPQVALLRPRIKRAARLATLWLSSTLELDTSASQIRATTATVANGNLHDPESGAELPREITPVTPPGQSWAGPSSAAVPLRSAAAPAEFPAASQAGAFAPGSPAARALADRLARVEAQLNALQKRYDEREQHYRAVSHEIRNAAHAFTSWAFLLRRSELSSTPWFAPLGRAAEALQRRAEEAAIVLTNSNFPVTLRPFDLLPVSAQAVELVRPMADSAGVTLSLAGPLHLDELMVVADPERVAQVVHNLLRNAIEATPNGGSVRLTCAVVPDGVEVQVEDSGRGIAADRAATIFDGLAGPTSSPKHGFGVGLRLSHSLAERMGGSLVLRGKSSGAEGACFVLKIPGRPA
jgi:hypothetical protein